jgi:tripartite-type tricarboxylate transporter receptor subunit TctC
LRARSRAAGGIKLLSVPYKGGAQAVTDVLAGNVSIYFSGIPPSIGHVKAGKLVALGIAGTRPVPSLPNVPILATGALQRLDLTAWFGFFVPKGTSNDIVVLLNGKLRQIIDSPEVSARLVGVGVEPGSMSVRPVRAVRDRGAQEIRRFPDRARDPHRVSAHR